MRWQHEEDVDDCMYCKGSFSVTRRKVRPLTKRLAGCEFSTGPGTNASEMLVGPVKNLVYL